jgi:hypothetical protein
VGNEKIGFGRHFLAFIFWPFSAIENRVLRDAFLEPGRGFPRREILPAETFSARFFGQQNLRYRRGLSGTENPVILGKYGVYDRT